MSAITTHVLDTSLGKPAAGVQVRLDLQTGEDSWEHIGEGRTDADGRLRTLMGSRALEQGTYRLTFAVAGFFSAHDRTTFFPEVVITFAIADASQHYHVPLLLSPYGYSTYRGS